MEKIFTSIKTPRLNRLIAAISFSWLKKHIIVEITSLAFVVLFLYTGISKFMDYPIFKEQLAESPVLSPISTLIALGLPIVEFIISFLLFFPRWRRIGLIASLVIMIGFTLYIIILLTTSSNLPCSCGGVIELLSWPGHIAFNSILILLTVIALKLQKQLTIQTELSRH
jgi:uncharacterized membrane protein YphA (DoxX/SURF4 family)